ncbi:MAG: hypothetical protein V4659_04755 [Pseudomonadota bacterium]
MRRWRIIGTGALLLGASAAGAQTTARPCLTGPEAEAVFLAVAPPALKVAGLTCAASLPPGALLRQPSGAFVAKLEAASDAAWPAARGAIGKLAGPAVAPLLDSELARPALAGIIAPLIVADLKPADCPKLDRLLTLLSPLPARSIAALGVTILQYAQDDARRGKQPKLPLCPTTP